MTVPNPARTRAPRLAPVALAILVAACAPPPRSAVAQAPVAAGHHSDELQQLMRRMNDLLVERNQTELELDKQRLARARDLAASAVRLAANAGELAPSAAAGADAQREFTEYAHRLANEAALLGQLAEQRRYDALAPQMERVAHQCAACHLRFRQR